MSKKTDFSNSTITINGSENVSMGNTFPNARGRRKDKTKKHQCCTRVFVAHGHDKETLDSTVRFLRGLGLEVIVSIDLADKGQTILEKIATSSDVAFAVVLYTPCDVGGENNHSQRARPRARQNVVFEHGYLLAKLGRDRVFLLTKDDLELPSDIAGTPVIPLDTQDWQSRLNNEIVALNTDTE